MAGRRELGWRFPTAAACVAGVLVLGVALSAEDTRPASSAPPLVTSTTTTPPSTAAPVANIDPLVSNIAAVIPAEVEVMAEPPAELNESPQAEVDGVARRATFASTSPERADAPALPTLDEPIQGRHRTEAGWLFGNPTPFGNPLTFSVVEDHGDWLKVQMPVRPNGLEGWIRASDVTRSQTTTRVIIDLSERRLQAFDRDQQIADTAVVIGKDSTRTPTGRSYITDIDPSPPKGAYGPFVLALSVYSQDLDVFGGGVPVIAVHGTNRPDLLGSAASNGCVRIPNDVITLLKDRLPLGTPVDIQD